MKGGGGEGVKIEHFSLSKENYTKKDSQLGVACCY